jgi:serine/threonine-protein kinase
MANSNPLIQLNTLLGGKYRLGPVVGSGGVATVYRATHIWTEREVAVKVLDPSLPHFKTLREGFLREARATVQLKHPNVVDVLDMGEDGWETAYLVMELLEGPTLRDVLFEHGHLSEEDTLSILLPLVNALERAHELGIVHRDFKPENIMLILDAYGVVTPKLLDFGVAEILQDLRSRDLRNSSDVIMGTPQYMAPEQAHDERALIGPHTDVWGVGVVWYECLTGHAPFEGDSALEMLHAVCESVIDFDAVPSAYVPLLQDALNRSPDQRIGSLTALKARIEDMGIVIPSTPPPNPDLSSWPPPATSDGDVQRTLAGVGPSELLLAAPMTPQIDSELLSVPSKSNRTATLGGLALAIAVALAAWWTVRGPSETPQADDGLASTKVDAEAVPARTEPVATPEDPLPAEPVAMPEDPLPAEPIDEISAEPETKVVKPTPPKARRKNAPVRRPAPPPPKSSQYQKPPELVTEW